MNEFLKITPENHDEVVRKVAGKLFVIYFSTDCVFCRQAILEMIRMPENDLFTYAVCRVDGQKDFRLQENMLSLPTFRVYENGALLRETSGYHHSYGIHYDLRESIEKCGNYHTVYADNAATTKMSKKALKAFADCAKENYGNPSTGYEIGVNARESLNRARAAIRSALHLEGGRIIFTGGGSEADNQALYSAYREGLRQNRKHIITSAVEHHAVLHTLEQYQEEGFEVTVLPVNGKGLIDLRELEASIRPDTILVSIMYANNETGTIQPVKAIGEICRAHNVLYHCDAVQAIGHTAVDLSQLNISYLTMAAHKFNGPKGVGALVVSQDTPVSALVLGGGQESGYRAGTENVPGICAMAAALEEHIRHLKKESGKIKALTDHIISCLQDVPGAVFNGDIENRLPGTVNVSFQGIGGRELLFLLDAKYGICVSGGSACNTGAGKPSHVLLAMGLTDALAESAVRISLSQDNTIEDADYIVQAIQESVAFLSQRR